MNDFFDGGDDPLSDSRAPSLVTLARELVQALEPEALLPAVAEAVCRVVGGERMLLLGEQTPGVYRQTLHRSAGGVDLPMPGKLCLAACDDSLRRGEVVFSTSPHGDTPWAQEAKTLGLVGLCAAPVRPQSAAPMVIYADSGKAFATGLGEHAREVLALLVSHAALAIDNAHALFTAAVDAQTHLHPRDFFLRRLNEECLRSVRYRRNLSLAMVSVDGAEALWRELGEAGEAVAAALGARVQKNLRQADVGGVAGPASFFVLMPETPVGERYDPDPLHAFITRLHADIAEHPFARGDRPVTLGVRVAVVTHLHPQVLTADAFRRDVEQTSQQAALRGQDLLVCR